MKFCDFCLNKSKENDLIKCLSCSILQKKDLFFCEMCFKLHNDFHNKDGDFCLNDVELTGKDLQIYNFLYKQEKIMKQNNSGVI